MKTRGKGGVISLNKLCKAVGIGYQHVWNNWKRRFEERTITDDQRNKIFAQLDEEVKQFKKKFYE